MLKALHENKGTQLIIGLVLGNVFGFLLQKGGVTRYDVIIGQLLLKDFTVVKVMLTAVLVGKIGIHFLRSIGMAQLHPKPGSVGSTLIGSLIFGAGFAILGYCPSTMVGAVGQGCLDALFGGIPGMLLGACWDPRVEWQLTGLASRTWKGEIVLDVPFVPGTPVPPVDQLGGVATVTDDFGGTLRWWPASGVDLSVSAGWFRSEGADHVAGQVRTGTRAGLAFRLTR